jgi:hypothetical protein
VVDQQEYLDLLDRLQSDRRPCPDFRLDAGHHEGHHSRCRERCMDPQKRRAFDAVVGVVIFVAIVVILIAGLVADGEIPYGLIVPVMAVGWIISLVSKRAARRDRENGPRSAGQ